MYQNSCKKCGSISLHTEVKGSNTGLYCSKCGKWQQWLNKEELRVFEYSQKTNNINKSSDYKDMSARLNDFVEYLDRKIDSEYEKLPLSSEDAIRKNSYCLALEQDKNAILNILRGYDFNYIGD